MTEEKIFLWENDNGIHARPAGIIANEASKFKSDIRMNLGDQSADAKGVFSLMGLGVKKGDKITLIAHGEDEKEAISHMAEFLYENSLASELQD